MTTKILHIIQMGEGGEGQQQNRIKKILNTRYQNITISFRKTNKKDIISLEFPIFLDEEFIFTRNLLKLLRLSKNADIMIHHNIFNYSSLLSYLLLRLFNMHTYNIIIFHSNIDGPGSKLRTAYYKIRKTLIINLAPIFSEKLVFLTDAQKKGYQQLCLFNKKFDKRSVVINNFIDEKFISKYRTRDFQKIKILFVGRLSYFKGFQDLITLIGLFSNKSFIEFGIVGNGSLVKKIPNCNNVKYLGTVSHDSIYKIYDNYNILILPSYTEVFPLVVLEAMARGLVILVSDLPGFREIIKEDRNGYLFPSGNIEKMRELILYLMKNPKEIERISKNNLNDIWKFTAKKQASKYLNLCEGALK